MQIGVGFPEVAIRNREVRELVDIEKRTTKQ